MGLNRPAHDTAPAAAARFSGRELSQQEVPGGLVPVDIDLGQALAKGGLIWQQQQLRHQGRVGLAILQHLLPGFLEYQGAQQWTARVPISGELTYRVDRQYLPGLPAVVGVAVVGHEYGQLLPARGRCAGKPEPRSHAAGRELAWTRHCSKRKLWLALSQLQQVIAVYHVCLAH